MPTKVRLLIYQGSQDWLDKTMGRSLPQGRKAAGHHQTITVVDVPLDALRWVARLLTEEEESEDA